MCAACIGTFSVLLFCVPHCVWVSVLFMNVYMHHSRHSFVRSLAGLWPFLQSTSFLSLTLRFTLFILNFWTTFSIVYCIICFSLLVAFFCSCFISIYGTCVVYCPACLLWPRQLKQTQQTPWNTLETFTKQPDWQTNNFNSFKCDHHHHRQPITQHYCRSINYN